MKVEAILYFGDNGAKFDTRNWLYNSIAMCSCGKMY